MKRQCNVKKIMSECQDFVTSSFQGQIIFSIENFGSSATHTLHKLTAFVEAGFFFSESNTFVNIRATMIVMMFVWIQWQGRSPGFYICLQRFY